jgi:UDP-glucose 4-epimerase
MRVIVTGVSGFLGNAVLKKLIEKKIDCVGVSRKSVDGCIQVSDYADSPLGDVLIHFAEINNRTLANQLSNQYEYQAISNLHALVNKNYSKVIYASSSVLYGDNICLPRKETDPVNAIDSYSRIKLINERFVLSRGGVAARFSNIYGPGMSADNLLSHIFSQVNNIAPIRLKNLNSVRDFIWIEDAANAVIEMIDPTLKGLFNVGTGVGTSIRELVKIVLELSNQGERELLSEELDLKESCIVLDITKALSHFKLFSCLSLNEGLNRLINKDTK